MEKMLTVKEVCQKHGIGRYTVDRAIHTGKLTAYRPNMRDYRLKEADVEKWLDGAKYKPLKPAFVLLSKNKERQSG